MDVFVHKYQPDRYKLWKAGKDNAAINHSKATPEAARFLADNKNQLPAEDGSEVTSSTQEDKRSLLVHTILISLRWPVGAHSVGSHVFIQVFRVSAQRLTLGQSVS